MIMNAYILYIILTFPNLNRHMKYYYFFSHLTCLDIFLGDLRANAVLASYSRSSDLGNHMIDTFTNIYGIK